MQVWDQLKCQVGESKPQAWRYRVEGHQPIKRLTVTAGQLCLEMVQSEKQRKPRTETQFKDCVKEEEGERETEKEKSTE